MEPEIEPESEPAPPPNIPGTPKITNDFDMTNKRVIISFDGVPTLAKTIGSNRFNPDGTCTNLITGHEINPIVFERILRRKTVTGCAG